VNDILKQRLVGALILVALGVVFWPIIFVQPPEKATGVQQPVPPRPDVSTTAIEAPDEAGLRASPELSGYVDGEFVEIQLPDESAMDEGEVAAPTQTESEAVAVIEPVSQVTRAAAPEALAIDSDGVPVAWILQVASVSSEEKAEQLRQRLVKMNIKAYVKTLRSGGKKLYRVYVGPKFERAKLEQLQAEIDAEFGVTTIVARYIP